MYTDLRGLLYIAVVLLFGQVQALQAQEDSYDYDEQSIHNQLLVAADNGDSAKVATLIGLGARVNSTTWDGFTPLMFAAQNGNTDIIKMLLKQGAMPDVKSSNGYTALIFAISNGYIEAAEQLLRSGTDVDLADNNGFTPLMHAIEVDSFYLPDMLLYYEAKVAPKDESGRDALMLASKTGSYEIAYELLDAGAPVNSMDNDGNTPLHYAASAGEENLMELLIANGASLETVNNSGYTPLSVAVAKNKYEAVKLLISYGADINSRISASVNPLSLAMANRNDSMKRLLLNNEAVALRRPDFNRFALGINYRFNADDTHTGISFGISDSRYHLMPQLEYAFRVKAVRVLDKQDDQTYYQFWERRHFITLTLDKAFLFQRFGKNFSTSAFAGIGEALTFGGYKGSEKKPGMRLVFNPRIGCMMDMRLLRVKFSYEYMDLQLKGYEEGWFSISMEFMMNRSRGISLTP